MCAFCIDHWKKSKNRPEEPSPAERELFEKRNKDANTWPEDDDVASTAAESSGTAHETAHDLATAHGEEMVSMQTMQIMLQSLVEVVQELRARLQAVEHALVQNRPPGLDEAEQNRPPGLDEAEPEPDEEEGWSDDSSFDVIL